MKVLSSVGLILGMTMTFGLAACGSSSGGSDVSDVSSAAMVAGDLPSGPALNPAATADTYSAYAAPTFTNFGKITSHGCGGTSATPEEKNNFKHGLAQSALYTNELGIVECAEVFDSADNATKTYDAGLAKLKKNTQFKMVSVSQVGDGSFAAEAKFSGGIGRAFGFRHGNTLIELEFVNTKDTIGMDTLAVIAKKIDGRLK